ncbi:MAG TPA: O-antigen ligase family protein [Verrucomicrobiae bacterium]|nr:O-antigen ligase family protein [Verrucomicrobiae bacterium]
MNRETLDQWCERGILALVLSILVFGPLAFGAARLQEFLVIQALTTGVLVLWVARLWLNPRPKFLWPPICWAVLAFVAYAVGRYLTCEVEYVGRQELLRVLVYAALFLAILNNLHRQESTQIISFTLIFLAMAISFYAVYQFATGSNYVWFVEVSNLGRASGTYISPNHLAGLLEMLLPLALAYTLVGREKPLMKIFIGYAALVILVGITVTASRGGWAATLLALSFLCAALLSHRTYRLPALVLLVAMLGGAVLVTTKTAFFKARFSRAFGPNNLEMNTRLDMWDAAVKMWRDHFWVGVGPGHYDSVWRTYRPASVQLRPERAHNDYLNTLADWGTIGATLIGAAIIALGIGIAKSWKSIRRGENDFSSGMSNKFAFLLGATGGMVALLVHSAVDFNLQIPANAIIAVSLMALLSSHWRFTTERYWFSAHLPLKASLTVLLLAGIAYLGQQDIHLGRERVFLRRAAAAEANSDQQAAMLEKAYEVEPGNFETAYAIGEIYRKQSFQGEGDYEARAHQAIDWYQRGTTNNPRNGYNYMRWGMMLDFLGDHAAAEPLFLKADQLDPNGYFTTAHVGKHYVDSGEYAAARPWLERSLLLFRTNEIAEINLRLANQRLLEAATNETRSLLDQLR